MHEGIEQAPIMVAYRHGMQGVNARDLHGHLGVGRDFTSWVKGRIEQYGFVEYEDYEVFTKSGENPLGGRPLGEYFISVDMAKELCLVENNERGRACRRYFIACERTVREAKALLDYFKTRGRWTFGEVHKLIEYANRTTPPLTIAEIAKLLKKTRGTVRPIVHMIRGRSGTQENSIACRENTLQLVGGGV